MTLLSQNNQKKYALLLLPAAIFFLSIAQHVFRFWEKPALWMSVAFLIFVPVLAAGLFFLLNWIPALDKITRNRFIALAISSVLLGATITWFFYKAPYSYHTVTITPVIDGNQQIELLEIKSSGAIISVGAKKAAEFGWQVNGQALIATGSSQPLLLSFKAPVNAPVILLFSTSPQSGGVIASLENQSIQLNLKTSDDRQTTSRLYTRFYRGISGWIFNPLLILVDLLTFGCLFLAIFFLQEIGQDIFIPSHISATWKYSTDLIILLSISLLLHTMDALSVPLSLYSDSPSYLAGALHWLQYGNLDTPLFRGPGTTFLFTPILYFSGRNPWALKILLHLLAIACVPLSYRIGWQLGKSRWIAFLGGLVTVLCPDLFLYSDVIMSDVPNIVLVLLFCTFMISALETFQFKWIIASMLVASFATLLRTENLVLLLIALFAFSLSYLFKHRNDLKNPPRNLGMIAFAFLLGMLPVLWWSAHNQRVSGFFGLSNYTGAVLYDGWIYFGDASGLSFSDPNSAAIQKINAAVQQHPMTITDQSGVPTSWEALPSLLQAGYTDNEAFALMQTATLDSLKRDLSLDFKLLQLKIKTALDPGPASPPLITLPLPSENYSTPKMGFFDEEHLSIPFLIMIQRKAYEYLLVWNYTIYRYWVYLCIWAMIFSLYRSPSMIWLTLILIIATRIFIPNIIGLSHWRYTLAGLIPLQIVCIHWITAILYGIINLFQLNRAGQSNMKF